MATDPRAPIYDALRKADAAGDAAAVARLSQYLKDGAANDSAPITDPGTTMGFNDEAPTEASRQLSDEDTVTFYKMLRGDGAPRASAKELRDFVASKGLALNNAEEIVNQRDRGGGVVGQITYPLPQVEGPGGRTGATARGVGDTLSFGTINKLGAAATGVASAVQGGDFSDAYHSQLDHNNGMIASDEHEHPYYRIAGQLIGGLAIPAGLEGVGYRAGASALREGATLQEARGVAAAAVRNRLATTGAGYGAAHGAGSADNLPDAVRGAVTEGALGATGGLALGAAGQVIDPLIEASRVASRALPFTDAQRVAAAADRQGIDLLPADVGGPTTRRLTSAAAQAPLSASPIINRAQQVLLQGQQTAERAAAMAGTAADPATAGEAARAGAQDYIASSRRAGGTMYDRAGSLAGDARIDPIGARDMLDQQIARLRAVPGGGQGLDEAVALRDSLNGRFSVQGIRDMRTEMFIDPALRGSPMDTRMRQIVDAAATDVENGLRSQGRGDAADAFRDADAFWRDRINTIDNVLRPIIGKDGEKNGEAISKALDTAAKGDVVKAQRFLATLPEDQQGVVRASFINRLGRATKGQQNDAGDAFSLSTFLSNWSDLSDRARAVMFNPEQRAALTDLARVANGVRSAQKYANHSNSAGGVWGNLGVLSSMLTGGAATGHTVAGAVTGVGGLVTQLVGGRLLASPRFARWLARAPRTQLSAPAYLDRLSRIARAEPAIASDVLGLQARLSEALAGGGSRPLAAQDKQDPGANPPKQNGEDGPYREWLQSNGIREDPTYDTRAAFKAGLKPDERGHLSDAYKMPNHPTFSDESVHNGEAGKIGGKWVQVGGPHAGQPEGVWEFRASPWNLKNMSKQQLEAYFDSVEPGNTIVFPDGDRHRGAER